MPNIFTDTMSINLLNVSEGKCDFPILQLKKLRLRNFMDSVQYHTATKMTRMRLEAAITQIQSLFQCISAVLQP